MENHSIGPVHSYVSTAKHSAGSMPLVPTSVGRPEIEEVMDLLDAQVYAWSPACHAFCIFWAISQAMHDVLNGTLGDFDRLAYAIGRLEGFKRDLTQRGIEW